MENLNYDNIVERTLEYKLNSNNIKIRPIVYIPIEDYCLEVYEMFGIETFWVLGPFNIADICQYFEEKFMEELFDNFLDNKIGNYYNMHNDSIINWIDDDVQDMINDQLFDYGMSIDIKWETLFKKILNQVGKSGLLSDMMYESIILGYFESVARKYFKISPVDVRYIVKDDIGQVKITFYNDTSAVIKTDLFRSVGPNIYHETNRLITTDFFLNEIRSELKELIWKRTNST